MADVIRFRAPGGNSSPLRSLFGIKIVEMRLGSNAAHPSAPK